MDQLLQILSAPWVQAVIGLLGIFVGIPSVLSYIQERIGKRKNRDENHYLEGVINYLHKLNRRSSFDEAFFVERDFRLKQPYQPREFFMSKHRALFPQIQTLGSEAGNDSSGGYYTSNLFKEARAGMGEPIIILGEPGSGKSVSSRQLAMSIATNSLKSRKPERPIPVFLSLNEYTGLDESGQPVDFYSFLELSLESRGKAAHTFPSAYLLQNLPQYLDSGRIFFILDSLDEMPPATFQARCAYLSTFIDQHGTNKFVIACRSNDFAGQIKGREAYLDKLKPKEIESFIRKRQRLLEGHQPADVFQRIMDPSFILNSVVDNPFYLNLILYFLSIKGFLPENFPRLFEGICEDWAEREAGRELARQGIHKQAGPVFDEKLQALTKRLLSGLAELAFGISNSAGFGTYIRLSDVESLCARPGRTLEVVNLALRLGQEGGLLDVNQEEAKVRFIHHKFQEYFAAKFLNEALSQGALSYEKIPSICRNIWWDEVTAILTSIADHPEEIIKILFRDIELSARGGGTISLLQRDYWLVGRCLQRMPETPKKEPLVHEVISHIERELNDYGTTLPTVIDCLRALGEIDNPRAVHLLSTYLESNSKILRELAFAGLSRSQTGRNYLMQHVHRIGFDIYLRGRFGGRRGRYAKNIRSITFSSAETRLILACYAGLGRLFRSYKSLFTLLLIFTLFKIILSNIYSVLFIGVAMTNDIVMAYFSRKIPTTGEILINLARRSLLLVLLASATALGFFTPPVRASLSIWGLWFGYALIKWLCELAVVLLLKKLRGDVFAELDEFERMSPWQLLVAAVKAFKRKFVDGAPDSQFYYISMVSAGFMKPTAFVREHMSSVEDLNHLMLMLKDADFGGREIEIYEAIQNKERQLLQKTITPRIIDFKNGQEEKA
ncbi:MAG TPA: NACHT domain-containing protein [Pyrinomonadaceae bacterium]|jgi:hypothetical protein